MKQATKNTCPNCNNEGLDGGSHCGLCGFTLRSVEKTMRREQAKDKNEQALFDLMRQHKFFLPQKTQHLWRPTQPYYGTHTAVPHGTLQCLATDGCEAMFLSVMDNRIHKGHVQWFEWSTEQLNVISYYDEVTKSNKTFTQVIKSGSPPPLFTSTSHKVKAERPANKPKPKSKKSIRQAILADL